MNGSTSLIVPIDINKFIDLEIREDMISYETKTPDDEHISGYFTNEYILEFIKYASSLQAGDKDVFVKEEFDQKEMMPYPAYKADFEPTGTILDDIPWRPASQITKEQSRFSIDIEDARVVRVQDIEYYDGFGISCPCLSEFLIWFNKLMEEYNEGVKYEDSPYVFLYDVKVTTKEFYKETKDK